jgi:hypothetical protein
MENQNLQYKDYDQNGLEFLSTNGRPIPGQSLTNSPDTPYPWETPPEYTDLNPAIDALFIELTEEDVYLSILGMIEDDVSVGEITQLVLFDGFQKGLWNPDLLMLLIEPTMYMILALAEKAGIPDIKLYQGEENDPEDIDDQVLGIEQAIEIAKDKIVPKMQKGEIPETIVEKIEAFVPPERPSLLERPEQKTQPASLLARGDK